MGRSDEITTLLDAARAGSTGALDEVFAVIYDELHELARCQRGRWRGDYTLNTTALVHEAYLKLVGRGRAGWSDRAHFLAVAATAMRQILVNYAQMRSAQKRGGGAPHVSLQDIGPIMDAETAEDVLALHEALGRLARLNERQAKVVEARFFAGMPVRETAEVLGVSPATVKRDWALASAWLHKEIKLVMP